METHTRQTTTTRTRSRTNPLPRLQCSSRLGRITHAKQCRSRSHHSARTRRNRPHRQHTNLLPQMQPIQRRKTREPAPHTRQPKQWLPRPTRCRSHQLHRTTHTRRQTTRLATTRSRSIQLTPQGVASPRVESDALPRHSAYPPARFFPHGLGALVSGRGLAYHFLSAFAMARILPSIESLAT